jgi:hypothetical protein
MHNVYSSHIAQIGYDAAEQALYVVYANGRRGIYLGVPPEIADKAMPTNAPSIGQALHAHIRGRFEFRYLSQEDQQ